MPFPWLELQRLLDEAADEHAAAGHEAANDASEPPTPPASSASSAPSAPPPLVADAIADASPSPDVPRTYTAPPPFVPIAGVPETVRSIIPNSVRAARDAQLARQEARLQRARTRSLVFGIWVAALFSMGTLAYFVLH